MQGVYTTEFDATDTKKQEGLAKGGAFIRVEVHMYTGRMLIHHGYCDIAHILIETQGRELCQPKGSSYSSPNNP